MTKEEKSTQATCAGKSENDVWGRIIMNIELGEGLGPLGLLVKGKVQVEYLMGMNQCHILRAGRLLMRSASEWERVWVQHMVWESVVSVGKYICAQV